MLHLVKQIRCLPFIPHGIGEAVVAKADLDAHSQHGFDLSHAHAVVHVRARLMRKPGACLFEDFHLTSIKMDAMCGDGVWSEKVVFLQAVDHPHVGFLQAVVFVRLVLCSMNVKPCSLGRGSAAGLQCCTGKCQAGMQTKSSSEARMRVRGEAFEKPYIFADARAGFVASIAVGHFVTKHAAQSAFIHGIGDDVERAIDVVG